MNVWPGWAEAKNFGGPDEIWGGPDQVKKKRFCKVSKFFLYKSQKDGGAQLRPPAYDTTLSINALQVIKFDVSFIC